MGGVCTPLSPGGSQGVTIVTILAAAIADLVAVNAVTNGGRAPSGIIVVGLIVTVVSIRIETPAISMVLDSTLGGAGTKII